jgi:prepilin-type N-terminal cleavage/methylation domain-containing protein
MWMDVSPVMERNRNSSMRQRNGFTLGEMVTATAIVGSLVAIAYPNFMRVKMDTNMELVKQQMRVIGEKMVEIMGKTGQFPEEGNLTQGNETIPEELDITANLSGITNKGYEPIYRLFANGSNYVLIARPRGGFYGISGSACFSTSPAAPIAETSCTDATGLTLLDGYEFNLLGPAHLSALLNHPTLSREEKIMILAYYLERAALYEEYIKNGFQYPSGYRPFASQEGLPSSSLFLTANLLGTYQDLMQGVAKILSDPKKGITIWGGKEYIGRGDFGHGHWDKPWDSDNYKLYEAGNIIVRQVGYEFSDRIDSKAEYAERNSRLNRDLFRNILSTPTLTSAESQWLMNELSDWVVPWWA